MKVFVTVTMSKCIQFGVSRERVKELGKWLSKQDVLEHASLLMSLGMNVMLYTDFTENFAIYSDIDLTDSVALAICFPSLT